MASAAEIAEIEMRIKEAKQAIARVQVVKAAEKLHKAILRHDKLAGFHRDTQIMTNHELSILQARMAGNLELCVDPVVVERLMATAIHYRAVSIKFECELLQERQQRRNEGRRLMW